MKKTLLILILTATWAFSNAQQIPYGSNFQSLQFTTNPGMTAIWDYWEASANYRQQWVGFNDAPRMITASGQFPFIDANMSLGGFIQLDQVGPLKNNQFALSYAYKIKLGIFSRDQLSIGLMGTLSDYQVDQSEVVASSMTDVFLPYAASTKLMPNAGLGLFYTSNGEDDFDETLFYVGLGANQLLGGNVPVFGEDNESALNHAIHANATIGVRIIQYDLALEPFIWVNYANNNIYNINLGLRLEKLESFFTGLIYSTNQTLALQLGMSLKNDLLKDGILRIGTLGTYNIGNAGDYQGLGYEVYIAYRFR